MPNIELWHLFTASYLVVPIYHFAKIVTLKSSPMVNPSVNSKAVIPNKSGTLITKFAAPISGASSNPY
jgi:hypothetical protein